MKSLYEDSRSKSSCLESFSSSSLLAGILCSLLIQFFIFTLPEKSPGKGAICRANWLLQLSYEEA